MRRVGRLMTVFYGKLWRFESLILKERKECNMVPRKNVQLVKSSNADGLNKQQERRREKKELERAARQHWLAEAQKLLDAVNELERRRAAQK